MSATAEPSAHGAHAQDEDRDPPATPTLVTFIVGGAILVVIVVLLVMAHDIAVAHQALVQERPDQRFGAQIRAAQRQRLEAGLTPDDKRATPITQAMDATAARYAGRR